MGQIVLLDDLTINQMAAGEVVERPANAVKELVDNAIDAEATRIIVEIKNGGKTFIKVTDNGKGIAKDDMELSIERHATSKIRKVEDLDHTYTMGFRGEALASIAAVSRLTMISRKQDDMLGNKMVVQAGDIEEIEECGAQAGTTIIVENLFYNVPVRYKFLKNDATETRYIKEWIQNASLSNPQISFRLINNDKVIFDSNGNGNINDVIYKMFGKEIKENLVPVDYEEQGIHVTGIIGNTMVARENRKSQIFFLNHRYIKNAALTSSADQAFKGATGIGKYGLFVLEIEMPANFYDVNVHPSKIEVRFKDESMICRIIYHAIKKAMLTAEFLGNHEEEKENNEYIKNEYEFLTNEAGFTKKNQESTLIRREEKRKVEYRYIGILFKTYIVVEIKNELYLIDQHAAHERLLYEQIKEHYKNKIKHDSQMLLVPDIITLPYREYKFVEENKDLIENTGFDVELFGDNTIKVNSIPDLEYKSKTKNVFLDTLDEMISDGRTSIKDIEERFIATVACKAAVKANMDLSRTEVDSLIQNLLTLNNPYTCPHGRPTTIKISKEFIEGKLGKK